MSGLSSPTYLTCVKSNWPINNLSSESERKYSNCKRTIAGSPPLARPPSYIRKQISEWPIRRACLQANAHVIGLIHTTPKKNSKRSFIPTVRPTVHTNLSRKRSLRKRSSNCSLGFENAGCAFSCGRKTFWKRSFFWKRWRHDNHVISLKESSSSTNLKWLLIVVFSDFSGVV